MKTAQLHELIEFFHAFVGFCVDPSSLLSPLSKYNVAYSLNDYPKYKLSVVTFYIFFLIGLNELQKYF